MNPARHSAGLLTAPRLCARGVLIWIQLTSAVSWGERCVHAVVQCYLTTVSCLTLMLPPPHLSSFSVLISTTGSLIHLHGCSFFNTVHDTLANAHMQFLVTVKAMYTHTVPYVTYMRSNQMWLSHLWLHWWPLLLQNQYTVYPSRSRKVCFGKRQ